MESNKHLFNFCLACDSKCRVCQDSNTCTTCKDSLNAIIVGGDC